MAWQIINQHLLGILVSNPVETYSSHQQTLFWCTNLGEQKNGVGFWLPSVFACCLSTKKWRFSIKEKVALHGRKQGVCISKAPKELMGGLEVFFLHLTFDIQIPDEKVFFGPSTNYTPNTEGPYVFGCLGLSFTLFTVNSCNMFFSDFVFRNGYLERSRVQHDTDRCRLDQTSTAP